MKCWNACLVVLLAVLSTPADVSMQPPADEASIRNILEHYRASWLANDPNAVLDCFTENAVLMPHHGLDPVVGMKAINEFWFPRSGAKTTVLEFVRTIDEIGSEGTLAYVRGHSEVAWRVEEKGASEDWRNVGTYLAILKKQADGRWLITHMIWDDVQNQRKK